MSQNLAEIKCATCAFRKKAEENPKGFISRLWKWHTTWCPGWKAYQKALAEAEQQQKTAG